MTLTRPTRERSPFAGALRRGFIPFVLFCSVVIPTRPLAAQSEVSPLDTFEREMLELARSSEPFVVHIEAQLAATPKKSRLKIIPPGKAAAVPRRIGSGIVLDDEGGIITTASIVDGAEKVQVRTRSGEIFQATVVGIDRRTNVALLSAPGARLTPARLGESDLVTPGSRIVVVGSIPPKQPMSSFGTIQVDRGLIWGYSEVEMLQLNAPVIKGSSGAAVVNSEGRVVGMIGGTLDDPASRQDRSGPGGLAGYIIDNRVIASPGHAVSFAIPIEKAREIAAELKANGRVDRGFLGVVVQRAEAGQPGQPGVLVQEVMRGGPAARAGIMAGDLILQYAGQNVSIGDQLTFLVSATRPGSSVSLRYLRKGLPGETLATIGMAPNKYAFGPVFPEGVPQAMDGIPQGPRIGTGGSNQARKP